jgi:hypothetical protein
MVQSTRLLAPLGSYKLVSQIEPVLKQPMTRPLIILAVLSATLGATWCSARAAEEAPPGPYASWKNGPSADASYFPIGVWLQSPAQAERYKKAGVNLYIALYRGPTEKDLAQLKAAGMRVFCSQNAVAMQHRDDPTIAGWLLPDEPDNAQEVRDPATGRRGYGPPVKPEEVFRRYQKAKDADPTRPVLLNLGQGVTNPKWKGRGSQGKPEDYPQYVKAADIVSFDIYPVANVDETGGGPVQLPLVGQGVDRLVKWTEGKKPVWNCLECTGIRGPEHKATPQQVRAEAWLSIVHGSRGIVWFVHQFKPTSDEHALLDDPEMLDAVTKLNHQIQELAPVLNGQEAAQPATVSSTDGGPAIDLMTKRRDGVTYVFAVIPQDKGTKASFTVSGLPENVTAEVIGEDRRIEVKGGRFDDAFNPYGVHLYRIR